MAWRIRFFGRREAAARGLWIPVRGCSMMPALRPRDRVLVELDAPAARLCCGAIVVVAHRSGLIVHRIVALRAAAGGVTIVTKGDAVAVADRPVACEAVLGVVVRVRRRRWGRWQEVEVQHALA